MYRVENVASKSTKQESTFKTKSVAADIKTDTTKISSMEKLKCRKTNDATTKNERTSMPTYKEILQKMTQGHTRSSRKIL